MRDGKSGLSPCVRGLARTATVYETVSKSEEGSCTILCNYSSIVWMLALEVLSARVPLSGPIRPIVKAISVDISPFGLCLGRSMSSRCVNARDLQRAQQASKAECTEV